MNLKGFKKIQDDEHRAVLKNGHGHEITIAKKALSKKHLEHLCKLPLHAAEGDFIGSQSEPEEFVPGKDYASAPLPGNKMEPPKPQIEQSPVEEPAPPEQVAPKAQAPVEQREPQAQQPVQTPAQQPQQEMPEQVAANHTQEMDQEAINQWQDRLQGHIKPETYHSLFAKKDTLGKIGTLFGLLISGAGSGLAHQPNMVLEMMNKEIDRDLEAQKKEVEGAQNYYRLHQQHELNKANIKKTGADTKSVMKDVEQKALENAKTSMQLDAAHQALQNAGLLPPGPMKDQAMKKANDLQAAVSQDIQKRNALLGQRLVSDPEGEFQKKQAGLRAAGTLGVLPGADTLARENEARYVPGFGNFKTVVPQDVRQEMIAKLEYDKAARKYVEFAKKHQGNWANLNPEERARIAREGAVLGAELQGKFRLKSKGGVYKEGEQKFIEGIIPSNATSFAAYFNQIPKVEATIGTNQSDLDNLAKGYGGSAPKFYKGKYWTRGENGEAVEVK